MNILIDELPTSVSVAGKRYPVNWGFRTFILIEICIFDQKISDEERITSALRLFYKDQIPDEQAFETMLWFYRGGKEESPAKGKGASSTKRVYCFEQDAPFIYSAFRTQYRIDLQDISSADLHWWKFKTMFESLGEDLKMSKIMYYRAAKTSGMGKEERAFINEMKKLYALDVTTSVDSTAKLAKRDMDMKRYLQRRVKEVNSESKGR